MNPRIIAAVSLGIGLGAVVAFATTVNISPNMGMPVPVVGSTPGPEWANDINASLSIIDSHDHSAGHGVQVTPDGLSISSDLSFISNNATNLRSSRYTAQSVPLAGASDLGAVYVAGVDLYYNDENGNQVRITQGGSVTGSTGTITGLPSGTASASFAGSTFTFESATSTPAIMSVGPVKIGTNTASPKTVTIAPPGGLAADYSLTTFNGLPLSTSYVTLDASGNLAATTTISSTSPFLAPAGSAAAPSYTFTGDTDTGMYHAGANELDFSTGGTKQLAITTTALTSTLNMAGPTITASAGFVGQTGSPTAPTFGFTGDSNTGIYHNGSHRVDFTTGGTTRFTVEDADIAPAVPVLGIAGTNAAPGYAFSGDSDTGMYQAGAGEIDFTVNSTKRLTVDTSKITSTLPMTLAGTGGNTPHACTNRTSTASTASAVSVTCSAGEILTGGGCLETGAHTLENSYPTTSTTWQCNWDAASTTIVAYGICCSI